MKILSEKQLKYNENVNLDRTPKKCYNSYRNIEYFQANPSQAPIAKVFSGFFLSCEGKSWSDMTDNINITRGKRVVITGMAAISPFGIGVDTLWENLINGKSGINRLSGFDAYDFPIKIGGQIPPINFEEHIKDINLKKIDRSSLLGLVTAGLALLDAGFNSTQEKEIAAVIGSGLGPCASQEENYSVYALQGWRKLPPITITKSMISNLASMVSIYYKLTGGNHMLAAACASGAAAIGQAHQMILGGTEKRVLCGGVDTPLIPSVFGAWINMRVLSQNGCRPFDKNRDGMVLAEGSAMVILEELETAKERGAKIYGEVIGYAANSDASHIAIPNYAGQANSMKKALENAGIKPEDIDYINAHGTSTPANDREETKAIKEVFGERSREIPISSNKSMLGHSMGASGAFEFLATALTIKNGIIPPTINYETPDPECDLDYVPNSARKKEVKTAISNSFAFGGNNSVLVLRRYEEESDGWTGKR
jgi:3-oxoacyl-[acyl-carrier-protein] synthase II